MPALVGRWRAALSGTALSGGGGGGMLDTATIAWVNAVVGAGGTVSTPRKTLVNDFIVGLKNASLFTKFDRLWLLAAENPQSALTDLSAAVVGASVVNSPTFTTDRGYTGDGSSNYVSMSWNPLTAAVNYTTTSGHISCWNATAGSNAEMTVGLEGSATPHIYAQYSGDGNTYLRVNDDPADTQGFVVADVRGLLLGNRSSSTARQGYRNGVSIGTYASTPNQGTLTNSNLLCYSRQVAAISVGGTLDATQQLAFYNLMSTYMAAVGVDTFFLTADNGDFLVTGDGSRILAS